MEPSTVYKEPGIRWRLLGLFEAPTERFSCTLLLVLICAGSWLCALTHSEFLRGMDGMLLTSTVSSYDFLISLAVLKSKKAFLFLTL